MAKCRLVKICGKNHKFFIYDIWCRIRKNDSINPFSKIFLNTTL